MKQYFGRFLLLIFISYLMLESCRGFQKIAWGTGIWWGEYSMKWFAAYAIYIVFCIFVVILSWGILFRREKFQSAFDGMSAFRERLGNVRWLLAFLMFIFPVWLLQYTPWGVVFKDIYIRILIWSITVAGLAFFIKKGNVIFGWAEFIIAVLLTSSEFVIVVPFMNVTDYPFSLGWSEGNRMWDYSIMFGRYLYDYPADREITVLLDVGRQFVGGLPFIFPGLTIEMERFWIGLTVILPYLFLGFAAFRFLRKDVKLWILAGLWVLIFLKQGPIHPPLILCAVVVAMLWRSPLWIAIPLIAITGYAAEESRFTWIFAPGLWIGMLELAGADLINNRLSRNSWTRAISLGLAGAAGGYFGQEIAGIMAGNANAAAALSLESVASSVSSQPLLWYRLFPNATYGIGVLAGLLIATLPLIVFLLYLIAAKKWVLNLWQAMAVFLPLLAFLAVGIVVSTKIGGGGDLHNMDMFLIGLVFAAVIAWQKLGENLPADIGRFPPWVNLVVLLSFALPGLQSIGNLRSHSFAEDISWLVTLTDAPMGSSLDMYPAQDITESALETIRAEVTFAQSSGGEVLFMDQRQLLTFGYITNVPLVPEYEKKILMNQALGSNANYFRGFYDDLAKRRFALIISEPLRTPIKDSSFQFGEENNAWVKWVANPILCYYAEKDTLKEVGVQLFVPKNGQTDCQTQLP